MEVRTLSTADGLKSSLLMTLNELSYLNTYIHTYIVASVCHSLKNECVQLWNTGPMSEIVLIKQFSVVEIGRAVNLQNKNKKQRREKNGAVRSLGLHGQAFTCSHTQPLNHLEGLSVQFCPKRSNFVGWNQPVQ